MTRLRLVPYRDLRRIAEAQGFQWVRCRGSHNAFRNPAGAIVVIPDHGAEAIVRPLLRKILRDVGLTIDAYHELLDTL